MCETCVTCSVCDYGASRGALLNCGGCGKRAHRACLRAVVGKASAWKCEECSQCQSCGRRTPGDPSQDGSWTHSHSMCIDCGDLKDKGDFCTLCQGVYDEDDWDLKMLECMECKHWIHIQCDNIDETTYNEMTSCADAVDYNCAVCRAKLAASSGETAAESGLEAAVRKAREEKAVQDEIVRMNDFLLSFRSIFEQIFFRKIWKISIIWQKF